MLDPEFLFGIAQQQGKKFVYADRCFINLDKLKELSRAFKYIAKL